jgi:hypothetical protein
MEARECAFPLQSVLTDEDTVRAMKTPDRQPHEMEVE